MLAASLVFASISAGGLGAGIVAMAPVLDNILVLPQDPAAGGLEGAEAMGKDLPVLARELNARLAGSAVLGWVQIPESWIEGLPRGRFPAVLWIVVGLGALTVIGATANFLHQYLALTVISRTIANIRRDAFRRAVHLPLKTVLRAGTTDTISRVVYDTATLGNGFNALLGKAVAQATKGLAALVVALAVNWRLTLVALPVAFVMYHVIRKLGKRIRRASRTALEGQAGLYQTAAETLGGLRVVKVYTSERTEAGRFHRINKQVVRQELRVRTARALSSPLIEMLTVFILGALALLAAKAIIDGRLDPRSFLVVFGSLGIAAASLKPLTGFSNDIQQAAAAADRIGVLLGLEPEPGHGHRLPRLPRHGPGGSVVFENVTFTYPSGEDGDRLAGPASSAGAGPAIRGVSLTVKHGETVAFVGPNGSGKTTLLSLVPRLFDPDQGRVLIDGRDIREVSVRSLRRQIGVVTQDTVLFAGTIRSNIAYGDPHASEERIREAARRARAEEFILEKPGGYDAVIGEGGAGLSGGQKQRLAIARAVLRDPAILILDEATSMIDADSEAKIAEALAEFGRGRTCLIVAHRLSTVMAADRIVVMAEGKIVDEGRHEELLGRCAVYRMIAQNQLVRADGTTAAAVGNGVGNGAARRGAGSGPAAAAGAAGPGAGA